METPQNQKPQSSKHNKSRNSEGNSFLKFSSLAFEMLGFMAIGVYAGYKLDERFETETPIFIIVGSFLGLIGAMIYIIRRLPKD